MGTPQSNVEVSSSWIFSFRIQLSYRIYCGFLKKKLLFMRRLFMWVEFDKNK